MGSNIFLKLEKSIGEAFPPSQLSCVKSMLTSCEFDRLTSLNGIDHNDLIEIEDFLNANRQIINAWNCCNSEYYKNQSQFKLLPGHKHAILQMKHHISEWKNAKNNMRQKKCKI